MPPIEKPEPISFEEPRSQQEAAKTGSVPAADTSTNDAAMNQQDPSPTLFQCYLDGQNISTPIYKDMGSR